jgi:hypothetical protein
MKPPTAPHAKFQYQNPMGRILARRSTYKRVSSDDKLFWRQWRTDGANDGKAAPFIL